MWLFVCSALSPVYPAAFPASLAGNPLWREDVEKRSVLQVIIGFQVPTQITAGPQYIYILNVDFFFLAEIYFIMMENI